jgi:hypothetical protein
MRTPISVALLLLPLLAACEDTVVGTCPLELRPSVIVEVVDSGGRPAAIGATAAVSDGTVLGVDEGFGDPRLIPVFAGNAGGTLDVRVTKPWHEEVRIDGVFVPEGACGVLEPGAVRAVLQVLPNAPPVRQVLLPPFDYAFGGPACGSEHPIVGYVLAEGEVDSEIVWKTSDPTVVEVEPQVSESSGLNVASLIPQCSATRGMSAYVIGESKADPSVKDSVEVTILY